MSITLEESWVCQDYKSGDEYQILTLFKEVFGREMSLAFWQWRFIKNPFGKGIIKLLFAAGKLIGHYAVIPMDVQVRGKSLRAVFSMTTMTHADYTGRGIFSYLAEETYKLCQRRGFHFVYGFPNQNSYYGFTRKLDWRGLGKMAFLEKELKGETLRQSNIRNIQHIERFDARINSLWDKVKQDYTVIVPRTEEFMNWRFAENPDANYLTCVILDDNNDISGYVILKVYAKEDVLKGHIVDMLSTTEEVAHSLLDHSQNHFVEKGIWNISCWIPQNSFYDNVLKEQGFTKKETDTWLGVKVFDVDNPLVKSVEHFSNWFITMGDSDVF